MNPHQTTARAFLLVLVYAALPASAQQDFSAVEIKATHVAGRVHMLEGRGGNIGVSVGDDGVLIVDDQFAPLAAKIRAALKTLGDDKPAFILNTHWHGDHTGGNVEFGPDGHIIAHTNVRKRLSEKQTVRGREVGPSPEEALPVITFDDSLSIHFNDEEIRVVHYPHCHTDGDSVVYFTASNVVHMGDLFFAGRFPFVDLDSGGDPLRLAESIAQILERLPDDAKLIPGHGPLSTKDDLRTYHGMLVETTSIVRDRIAAGKSFDEIKKEGLPEKWADWGTGFINTDRWLETLYTRLSKKE